MSDHFKTSLGECIRFFEYITTKQDLRVCSATVMNISQQSISHWDFLLILSYFRIQKIPTRTIKFVIVSGYCYMACALIIFYRQKINV